MKRLYVLRHSKAGQTNKKILDDHERSLTQKGVDLCDPISNYFKEHVDVLPEATQCSTAVRAKETAAILLENMGLDIKIQLEAKLYLASAGDIFSIVNNLDDSVSSLILIGHNPGLQQFCIQLSGTGDKKKFREMRNNFPPPSLAMFEIAVDTWSKVEVQSGKLLDFVIGKTL